MTYIRKGKVTKHAWPKSADHSEWLKLRALMAGDGDEEVVRLGASEVSVATGTNTFQCPRRLFFKLTGWHKKDFINEIVTAGHLLEPMSAQRWEGFVPDDVEQSLHNAVNGVRLRKIKKAKFFLTNSAYPYLSVSLDYVNQGAQYSPWTGEKYATLTPHEMKATNEQYYRLWPGGIARPYLEQVNIQMLVSGTKLAVFHVLIDGRYYKTMEIERDDELLEEILPKIEAFVENVKKGKRLVRMMQELLADGETEESPMYKTYYEMFESLWPPVVGIQDNLDLATEMYNATDKPSDQLKTATPLDEELMQAYLAENAKIKLADSEKIRLRSILIEKCGKWQGIRGESVRMINRRATETKKAYFDIR